MSIAWSAFPPAVDATASDILVGLAGGTVNGRFNATSWLFVANNLSDITNAQAAFDNISPLTTKGDLIWFDGTNNARKAIGTLGQFLTVGASNTLAWINNPSLLIANNLSDVASLPTTLTNLGLAPASNVTFASVTTTGLNKMSVANALTAHVGGGQGSALQLAAAMNRVTTVASSGDSVKLPSAVAGEAIVVINAAAANPMDCFPASGQNINALSPDTALSILANKTVTFYCAVNGTWNAQVTA